MAETKKIIRIALLEDDLSMAETVQECLEAVGYEVDIFVTGLDYFT